MAFNLVYNRLKASTHKTKLRSEPALYAAAVTKMTQSGQSDGWLKYTTESRYFMAQAYLKDRRNTSTNPCWWKCIAARSNSLFILPSNYSFDILDDDSGKGYVARGPWHWGCYQLNLVGVFSHSLLLSAGERSFLKEIFIKSEQRFDGTLIVLMSGSPQRSEMWRD